MMSKLLVCFFFHHKSQIFFRFNRFFSFFFIVYLFKCAVICGLKCDKECMKLCVSFTNTIKYVDKLISAQKYFGMQKMFKAAENTRLLRRCLVVEVVVVDDNK